MLAEIIPLLPRGSATEVGPGDDAAVMGVPGRLVVTTDSMIEGPDFRRAWSEPFDIGWKIAAVNLADIAAMGAVPTGLVIAFAAPPETPLDDLVGIARGLAAACELLAPGVGVVGGDLASAPVLTLVATAFGQLEGSPVLRSGAQPGDVVAVAGTLGQAAQGLQLLFTEAVNELGEPDAALAAQLKAAHPELIAAQLRPEPPLAAGLLAAQHGVHAMMDVSDGLAQDAARLAVASGVGIRFDLQAFAADHAFELYGGEDHALLATFAPETVLPAGFRIIGEVTAETGVVRFGEALVEQRGWEALHDWR